MRQPILANSISSTRPTPQRSCLLLQLHTAGQYRQDKTKLNKALAMVTYHKIYLLTDTSIVERLSHSLFILLTFYLDIYTASSLPTRRVSFIYRYASNYYGVCHLLAHWKLFSSLFYYWTGELGTAIHGIRI